MEVILLALSALRSLVVNPVLGGGGIRSMENVKLLSHLMQLIQGGQATAQALKAFAAEISIMAQTGQNPTTRDFESWTTRLDAALAVVAQAKARVEARKPQEPPLEE